MRIRKILFRAGIPAGVLALALTASVAMGGETMKLSSSAFQNNQPIPVQYTCDGKNISPPLAWSGAPATAKAYALTVVDPDAPKANFTHWIAWNLPMGDAGLQEDVRLHDHVMEGSNDKGDIGYTGPCPPQGVHHYVFTLYALDRGIGLPPGASKNTVRHAMDGHVLDHAQLVGTYQRQGQ